MCFPFAVQKILDGGFKYFFFHPYLGKIPNLTNIFNWVETTNQNIIKHFYLGKLQENWDAQGLSDRRACLAIILAATWQKTDGFWRWWDI